MGSFKTIARGDMLLIELGNQVFAMIFQR
nr:H+-transporting two-sector ATPase (EC 3.6.3.14) chain I, alternative version - Mycoplasma pneumoniae (strain ATCC 29342) [Mycoplasmoides pneumoniae]